MEYSITGSEVTELISCKKQDVYNFASYGQMIRKEFYVEVVDRPLSRTKDPGSQNKYLLPTWNDMRALKDIFFGDEEVEHKFSIKKYQYANLNGAEGWLHLWKPIGHEIDELVKREGE